MHTHTQTRTRRVSLQQFPVRVEDESASGLWPRSDRRQTVQVNDETLSAGIYGRLNPRQDSRSQACRVDSVTTMGGLVLFFA